VVCIIWAIVENRGAVTWDDLTLGAALIGASVTLFALIKYLEFTAERDAKREAERTGEADQESADS
jgi:hypothetical protein